VPTAQARQAAEQAGIEIRYYNIIYDLVDDVKAAMSGLLSPERRETFLGNAEILEVFNITKVGKVAGCRVTEGKVERGAGVRLIRDNVVIHEGKLKTLKRFKDEVSEVPVGQECGMAFENYEDIRVGDIIECFRVEMVLPLVGLHAASPLERGEGPWVRNVCRFGRSCSVRLLPVHGEKCPAGR
jgi:translation initiation factor IF-2